MNFIKFILIITSCISHAQAEFSFDKIEIPGSGHLSEVLQINTNSFAFVYKSSGYVSIRNNKLLEVDSVDFAQQINNIGLSPDKSKMAATLTGTGDIVEIDIESKSERIWSFELTQSVIGLLDIVYHTNDELLITRKGNNGNPVPAISLNTDTSHATDFGFYGFRSGILAIDRERSFLYLAMPTYPLQLSKLDLMEPGYPIVANDSSDISSSARFNMDINPEKTKIVTSEGDVIRTSSIQVEYTLPSSLVHRGKNYFSSDGTEIWALNIHNTNELFFFSVQDYLLIDKINDLHSKCGGYISGFHKLNHKRKWLASGDVFVCLLIKDDIFLSGFEQLE